MTDYRYLQALEFKHELAKWWNTPVGELFAEGFGESRKRTGMTWDEVTKQTEPGWSEEELWQGFRSTEIQRLGKASPYWVSPEIQHVVKEAAVDMPMQPLLPDDLPGQNGFVLLSENFHFNDVRGKQVGFRAFCWGVTDHDHFIEENTVEVPRGKGRGINLSFYSDKYDRDDEELAEMKADSPFAKLTLPLVLLHFIPFKFGMDYSDAPPGLVEPLRFVTALLSFMQQRIAVRTEVDPNRALRRRLAREDVEHIPRIQVITLRRSLERGTDEDDDAGFVDWSHRWMVDGHWRQQWYPSLETHRAIWISGYVKGPIDKPLILKEKVFKVAR